jgi:hypothetical protein
MLQVAATDVCCARGYTGQFCETFLGCSMSPCQNDGVCGGGGNCSCTGEWIGIYCEVPAPVDCVLSDTAQQSGFCDQPCGGGLQRYLRQVTKPERNGGQCEPFFSLPCNTQPCVVPPPPCGVDTCKCEDIRDRRTCLDAIVQSMNPTGCRWHYAYETCHQGSCEDKTTGQCAFEPVWISAYSSSCKLTGPGLCTGESPACDYLGGSSCWEPYCRWEGEDTNTGTCFYADPVDCILSDWTTTTNCSRPCGSDGTMNQTRTIVQQPTWDGMQCGPLQRTIPCVGAPVCSPCLYSEWQNVTSCSRQCSTGELVQNRTLLVVSNDGTSCNDALQRTVACNTNPCPPCVAGQAYQRGVCSCTAQRYNRHFRICSRRGARWALRWPVLRCRRRGRLC